MFRRTSKCPEILGRLDVRLNILEFQDVYTYFLGCLDVNPKKFLIYTGCAQNDDDNDNGEDDVEDDENGHVLMMIVMMARIMQSTKVK